MTVYSWKTGVSADWNASADWSPAGPPDAASADAVIAAAGIYTVTIAAGEHVVVDSLAFEGGGGVTLAVDGRLALAGRLAEITQNSGMIALAGSIAGGTVALDGGVLDDTGAGAISSAVILGGAHGGSIEIASGDTLTLTGPLAWRGGAALGPGILATTGTTTIAAPAPVSDGLNWLNSGTVLDGAAIEGDANGFANAATGTFDLTADGFQAFIDLGSSVPTSFGNAGLLEKTAGTGISSIWATIANTGTIAATSGTLELDAGATLGGTIGGTGGGVVQLGAGPGFVTTGSLAILDDGNRNGLRLVNGADWTVSGSIDDAGHLFLGNGTNVTLAIAAGGSFDFTDDDGDIVYGGGNTLSNAGLIAKVGGAGTSTIGLGFSNTGTVEAASGTLKLLAGVAGAGSLRIGAGSTLELASGAVANSNIVDFEGPGSTLKLDSSSTVANPFAGFGAGSRIDLGFASAVAAVIGGSTLTVTPAGGAALGFVATASLAGLYVTTESDGEGGTVVALADTTRIATGTTLDIAGPSKANVAFAGVGALQLEAPSRYAGTIGGLAAGDRIDLQGIAAATKVAVGGNDLVVTRFNGSSFPLATSGGLGGLDFVVTKDNSGPNSIITAESVSTAPVDSIHPTQPGATVDAGPDVIAEVFATSARLSGDTFGGFGGHDLIDITDLRFAAASLAWAGSATGGTLTVTDGIHTTAVTLAGGTGYASSGFGLAAGLHGGTEILFV